VALVGAFRLRRDASPLARFLLLPFCLGTIEPAESISGKQGDGDGQAAAGRLSIEPPDQRIETETIHPVLSSWTRSMSRPCGSDAVARTEVCAGCLLGAA
jgi:hypothetical protein